MRTFKYIWALPYTILGLIPLMWSQVYYIADGIICGAGLPQWFPWPAMTLGHVILSKNYNCAVKWFGHEMVHVRQYEKYGPFFLAFYAVGSIIALLRGKHPYYDNFLEREAYSLVRYPQRLSD